MTLADEFSASDTFWTRVSDDIGVREVFIWMPGDSGPRVRGGQYRRAREAKRKLVTAGDVRLASGGVLCAVGMTIGRQGHGVSKSDARRLGEDGDQDKCGENTDLYEHRKQQGAATRAASATELLGVTVHEARA